MLAVKQEIGIAIAIAMAIVIGIIAVEHSAPQVSTKRATAAKTDLQLNDHQRLRKILLGQEGIELPQR